MTTFILMAGLLALMACLAIAWPILRARAARGASAREANLAVYTDQLRDLDHARERGEISPENHSRAMAELRQRMAEDVDRGPGQPKPEPSWRWAGAIAGCCVLAIAAIAYYATGNPGALSAGSTVPAREVPHAAGGPQLAGMTDRLAARLRENPEDGEGWAMLGRSLASAGRFGEAAEALREASRRLPQNASILVDRADVLAMAQGRRFEGEPDRLIEAALVLDPRNVKALAVAGTSASARGDHSVAARHWRSLLALVPANGEMARQVEANVRDAERRAEAPPAAALTGIVQFAPGEAGAIDPAGVLFVVARPRGGKGRPIAVARLTPTALPAPFRLDDSHSLVAATPLSGFSEVILEARLSRSGTAEPRPGDPRSAPRAVRPGSRAIALELRSAGL